MSFLFKNKLTITTTKLTISMPTSLTKLRISRILRTTILTASSIMSTLAKVSMVMKASALVN